MERDSLGTIKSTWTYTPRGAPDGYTATSGGSTLFQRSYVRDSLDRITQLTEAIQGTTTVTNFAYDSAGRLREVRRDGSVTATYEYDPNGNRLHLTTPGGTINGTYDAQDRLTSYGATSYTYGSNGELQTKTDASGTTSYTYDALGNLIAVTLPDGTQITYVIDGYNRRVGKQVNGTLVQGFVYQGQLSPVAELDGSQQVMSRFVYGTRANVPDYMIKGGVAYRIIADHRGSVRLVVNTVDGTVAQRIDYDEFGLVTQNTAPSFQPFGFAGGLLDDQTGLIRFGARDYDARTGRWTAKDPTGFSGGSAGLYSYVDSDPINLIDPSGREAKPCVPVPLAPPGADIDKNIREALRSFNPFWFYDQVNKGGPWDYKQQGPEYEDFGNFNYGAVGTAFGFSEETLLRAAGWAQRKDKSWKPEFGDPTGGPPYGDDPRDQEQIKKGIRYYKCRFAYRLY